MCGIAGAYQQVDGEQVTEIMGRCLEHRGPDGWSAVGTGQTDADGRLRLADGPSGPGFEPGVYRITFDSGAYFAARGTPSFYPEITVTFEMTGDGGHYHVPLLLSPFAYSTYRGS